MERNNRIEKILYFVVGFLIFLVIIIAFAFPSKSNTVVSNEINNIVLERKEISLVVGDTYYLKYFISPSNITNINIAFNSTDENVAVIDSTGKIVALNPGTTYIKVIAPNGKYSECLVNVTSKEIPINSISLDRDDIQINVGESVNLNVKTEPSNATNHDFIWESSDESVATVTAGKVTALKNGTTLITVKTKNGKIAICDVEVGIKIETITFKEKSLKMAESNKLKLNVSVTPTNNTEKVYYSSSDNNIASVDASGVVTAKKIGNVTITAKSLSGVKDNVQINVKGKNVRITSALNASLGNNNFNIDGKTLLFGSDYQGSNRKSNFKAILENIKRNNINPSLISILGDYISSGHEVNNSISGLKEANTTIKSVFPNSGSLFVQGNHDKKDNYYLTKTGGYEASNYVIYVINEDDFPSNSSASYNSVFPVASALDNYLNNLVELNIKKPVFVITHVPLHYSSRGDNRHAYLFVDILNKYGSKLDIIFMFGHNHSSKYDDCLGGSINYLKKGSTMKHFDTKSTRVSTLKFTYLNAGYIGWANNSNKQVSCSGSKVNSTNTLTMSVFKIDDKKILLERYSSNAKIFADTINLINY